jgi:hypothetical protein
MPYQVSPARWRQLLLLLAAAAAASPAAAFCGAARLARLARPHMAAADALPPPASGAIPTRVALRAPLLPAEQLRRYVRADRAVRTLRAELPGLLDRPLTGDVFARNVTMGGATLGAGAVVQTRDELLSLFGNLRQLRGLSEQGLVLRVKAVGADVTAAPGSADRAALDLVAAITVELEWVGVGQQLAQLPGGDLVMSQIEPVMQSILRDQRGLLLSVSSRLAVDAAGRICEIDVERVFLNGDTALVPAFVRWSRTVFSGDLLRSALASVELVQAVASTLPATLSAGVRGPAGGAMSRDATRGAQAAEQLGRGDGYGAEETLEAEERPPAVGTLEWQAFAQANALALKLAADMPRLPSVGWSRLARAHPPALAPNVVILGVTGEELARGKARFLNVFQAFSQLHSIILESRALVNPNATVCIALAELVAGAQADTISRPPRDAGRGAEDVDKAGDKAGGAPALGTYRQVHIHYTYCAYSTLPPLPGPLSWSSGSDAGGSGLAKGLTWQEYRALSGPAATVSGWRQMRLQQPPPPPSLAQPPPPQSTAAPAEVGVGSRVGGLVEWVQAVTLGTDRTSSRPLKVQVDSVFELSDCELRGSSKQFHSGVLGAGTVTRHTLRRVIVNNEPFDPRTLWSLLPPAGPGVGGGRASGALNGVGVGAVGGAAATAAGMGVGFLSSAASVFLGLDSWEGDVVSGESEDEEDDLVFSSGGVSAGVYAQRVLRLMKSLHAQVPLLLVREPTQVRVLERDLVVQGQLQERLFASRGLFLESLGAVRMLMERARVQELREGVVKLEHRPDDSLRLSMRYVLGFPISQDLRAAFPMVPTVDARGKHGGVSVGEGGSEGRSGDDGKGGGKGGGVLPLNVEAVATITVNERGRASLIRLDSVKFNGQDTIPAPLKAVLSGIGLAPQDGTAEGASEEDGSKGGVRDAASALLRGLADLL